MTTFEIINRALLTIWLITAGLLTAGPDFGSSILRWLRITFTVPLVINIIVLIWSAP